MQGMMTLWGGNLDCIAACYLLRAFRHGDLGDTDSEIVGKGHLEVAQLHNMILVWQEPEYLLHPKGVLVDPGV